MTRARWCAGHRAAGAALRGGAPRGARGAARPAGAARAKSRAMREKVRAAHPVKAGRFDVKHSPGGMMDVEFAVQYLVLAHGAAHPELLDDVGNIALLQRAEAAGLLPAGVGAAAADAYRDLRRAQHRARLDEQPTQVEPGSARRAEQRRARALACGLRLTAAAPGVALAAVPRRRRGARVSAVDTARRSTGSRRSPPREPWRALSAALRPLQRAASRSPTSPASRWSARSASSPRVPRRGRGSRGSSPGR